MIGYFVSTSIGFAGLFLLYRIAVARLTYFQANRILLVLGSVLVLVAPFIQLNVGLIQDIGAQALVQLPEIEIGANRWGPSSINFFAWIPAIYILVLAFFITRLIWSLIKTYQIILKGERVGTVVIVPASVPAFSFFGTIVIPEGIDDQEYEAIVRHESIHLAQRHSIDRLFFSFIQSVFWFNPFVWLLNRELILVHEYLADEGTLQELDQAEYCRIILDQAVGGRFEAMVDPINTFSEKSIIKNRFNMMYSNRSNFYSKFRYLLLTPLIFSGLLMLAGPAEVAAQDADGKVHEMVEVMPEFPGGKEGLFKYMTTAIKYPEDAEAKGIEGKVIVSFTVDTDGSVTDIKRLRSVHPSIDEQAVEVVSSMPKWTPGEQDGKKVKVKMNLPIVYKLK